MSEGIKTNLSVICSVLELKIKDPHLERVLKTRGLFRIPAKLEIEFVLTIDHNFQSSFKQCPSNMYRDLGSASTSMKTFKAYYSICFN